MPVSVAVHDGLDGDFIALYIQEEDRVGLYTMATDRLRGAALSESDSADAIRSRLEAFGK